MVCPKHTKSCWSWTSALSFALTFINLLKQSQLFDKHLLTGFIACRGSRSVQSGLFLGRDWRWRRRLVSWYGESGALCVDELRLFLYKPLSAYGSGTISWPGASVRINRPAIKLVWTFQAFPSSIKFLHLFPFRTALAPYAFVGWKSRVLVI